MDIKCKESIHIEFYKLERIPEVILVYFLHISK